MAAFTGVCLLTLLLCFVSLVSSDVVCEAGFCGKYVQDGGCTTPAEECSINNATHAGLWMPSPTICNCCNFCLPFYGEGEHCSLGGPGTGFTVGRCGDGLTCTPEDGENFCRRMVSECHTAQDQFDERQNLGEVGAMENRPLCDGKGKYAATYCIPAQTCFCQSEDGERIFGEIHNMGIFTTRNMHCGCSRLHEKIMNSISPGVPHPVIGPRCTSDGNFNPVQCVDRNCFCVDRFTGIIISGNNRINLDEKPITELNCYDSSVDLFPQQSLGSPPYNYTTPCFEDMREKIEIIQQKEEEGYIVDYFNSFQECMPDGTYGRVMKRRSGLKICVDERNQQIEDYEAQPYTTEYDSMDCKCAQTSLIMASSTEKPVCCKNGNYRKIQCHRGMCRCVDSDGRQTSERENADVTKLSCYNPNWRTC